MRKITVISLILAGILLVDNIRLRFEIEEIAVNYSILSHIQSDLDSLNKRLRFAREVVQKIIPNISAVESKNDPYAKGDGGRSHGVCQVQLPTGREVLEKEKLTIQDLYDPFVNPFIATLYLDQLYSRFHSIKSAVSAYNGGLKKDSTGMLRIKNHLYVANVLGHSRKKKK